MNVACSLFVALLAAVGVSLKAQSVEVSLAPQSSAGRTVYKRGSFEWTLGAFRFATSGSSVDLQGITVTVTTNELDGLHSADGVQAWLDNGNEKWDGEANETEIAAAGGAPLVSLTFAPITLTPGSPVDIWIRCSFTGAALDEFYKLELADPADVSVSSGSVVFGAPLPTLSLNIRDSDNQAKDGPSCHVSTSPALAAPISLIAGALVVLSSLAMRLRRRQNTVAKQRDVGAGRSNASACDTCPETLATGTESQSR